MADNAPFRARDERTGRPRPGPWPTPAGPPRAGRAATSFTKPAVTLRAGDYVRILADRWPARDHYVDEGFVRVEHLRILDRPATERLFTDPAWHGQILVLSVRLLRGVLLLPVEDDVVVLAFVNPEQEILDRRSGLISPPIDFHAQRSLTAEEARRGDAVDMAHRPAVDEAELYPSRYPDPFRRRMALESRHGLREVPLSALPWPHNQDCVLASAVAAQRERIAEAKAAHAAAFLSDQGREAMHACEYHQPDWARLVRMLREAFASRPSLLAREYDKIVSHPDYPALSDIEKSFLHSMTNDPIVWNDGDDGLSDGQHRLCALRAAGIDTCPVMGNHLPDADYGTVLDASEHARRVVRRAQP